MLTEYKPISETCQRARSGWNLRFDKEIAPPDRADLETHLRSCPGCRRYAAQLEAITATLSTLGTPAVEPRRPVIETSPIPLLRLRRFSGLAACLILGVGIAALSVLQLPATKRLTAVAPKSTTSQTQVGIARIPAPADATPTVYLRLIGPTAESFVPMERSSSSPNVHLFLLYPTDRVALGDRLRSSNSLALPVTKENLQ